MWQAGAVAIPVTVLLLYAPRIPLMLKAMLWGALAAFPALLVLSGMADLLWLMLTFRQQNRLYKRRPPKGG